MKSLFLQTKNVGHGGQQGPTPVSIAPDYGMNVSENVGVLPDSQVEALIPCVISILEMGPLADH